MPDPVEPVRFYAEEDRRLPATIFGQLKELRTKMVESVAGSGAGMDLAWIKHTIGFIAGLDHAMNICVEAEKELSGE